MKNKKTNYMSLDILLYFFIGSTCFKNYHAHHQELATLGLLYVEGELQLGWSSVQVAGSITTLVVLEPATQTLLQPNCTSPPPHSKPRTTRPM